MSVRSDSGVSAFVGFRWVVLLCAVLLCASPRIAAAGPPTAEDIQRAQKHVDRGDTHFNAKRYESALAEYAAALAIASHPDLLWNIARTQEEMSRYGIAIAVFEQYVRLAPRPEDKASAEAKIVALKNKLKAAQKGNLTVETPAETARVQVGGVDIGSGKRVSVDLRPGRYRVRVTLAGHAPFEALTRVKAGKRSSLVAALKARARASLVIRAVDAAGQPLAGAKFRVDEGASLDVGSTIVLEPGEHTVRVDSAGRESVEKVVLLKPGQRLEMSIKGGPLSSGATYSSWSGSYVALPRADGGPGNPLSGALLAIAGGTKGQLLLERSLPLKVWRRKGCGGAATVTWRVSYRARIESKRSLVLDNGKISDCSCTQWCSMESERRIEVQPLPHRQGLMSAELVFLRQELTGDAKRAFRKRLKTGQLVGTWRVVRWGGPASSGEQLVLDDGLVGALHRKRGGLIPSWKRSKCAGSDRFLQIVDYPVRAKPVSGELNVVLATGKEVSCSCTGGCGTPPRLASRKLRLLVYPHYLVGEGILLERDVAR